MHIFKQPGLHQEVLFYYDAQMKKTFRLFKVSFQMLFIRANTIKKEKSTDNLTLLQMLGTLSCIALSLPQICTLHTLQIPSVDKVPQFGLFTLLQDFHTRI